MNAKTLKLLSPLLVVALFISACGAAASQATTSENTAEVVVEKKEIAAETMAEKDEARAEKDKMADEGMAEQDKMVAEVMAEKDKMADEAPAEQAKVADEAMTEKDKMADEAMAKKDEAMAEGEKAADEAMADEAVAELPAWFKAELTNVNTGETFSVADFKGKVVLVETMAVWCPLCTQQQGQIQALHELVGERDDLISLSLDIDPNESGDILKAHTSKNGFGWIYAVAPAEVAGEIGQLYGAQFLNPPATPMFIIDRQGEVHPLPFGHKDTTVLQEALAPFLNEGESIQ